MKTYLACGLLASLLLSGCTAMVIAYYYRQSDHSTRWECSHGPNADRCTLKLADAEMDVSSLGEIQRPAGSGTSESTVEGGQYGLEVHILAGKEPVSMDLLKTHLILPDDAVLAPAVMSLVSGVPDSEAEKPGADPQRVAARYQATYELRFALDTLPEAYVLSFAPLDVSGKQHAPPPLAMRIEYGSD